MNNDCTFSPKERRIVLIACCIGGFITPLITTMINLALPTIGAEFGISEHDREWLVIMFFLSSVAFLVPMSRLSDLYGKRKMFIIGIVIVLIASVMSAFADSFSLLLFWRLVTGVGAASIASASISMIAQVYPRSQRGLPLAINTMFIYIGASLGPSLGGFLTEAFGWESIFLAIIPFSVAALVPLLLFKGEFCTSKGEPFDIKGTILYGVGIVAMMYGVITLPNTLSLAFIAGGAVLLTAFFRFEKRTEYPVLKVGLFRERVFKRATLSTLLNYGASYAVLLTMSMYLQDVGGFSPGKAGMIILAQPVIQAVITPFAGRLSDKIDPRKLTTAGMLMMCIGTALMITITEEVIMLKVYLTLMITGLGYALFSAPNTNLIMGSVSPKNYSESSGLISAMRQIGMMVSVAILMCMISVFMGTNAVITDDIPSFINAVRVAFSICFVLAVIGTYMTWTARDKPNENATV
jgi:EmrB/QacA subfamily drug resistance transporter